MSPTAFLIGLLIVIFLGFLVAWPFLAPHQRRHPKQQTHLDAQTELDEQLTQTLKAIRDLDFDYDMGKTEADDYANQRKFLIGRGISIMIRLDELRHQQDDLDQEIESLVLAYRHSLQSSQPSASTKAD